MDNRTHKITLDVFILPVKNFTGKINPALNSTSKT